MRYSYSSAKRGLESKGFLTTAGGINSHIMLEYNSTAHHAARQQDESKYFARRLIMKTIREKQYRCYKLFLASLMGLVFLLYGQNGYPLLLLRYKSKWCRTYAEYRTAGWTMVYGRLYL